jgi:hypothetical protein
MVAVCCAKVAASHASSVPACSGLRVLMLKDMQQCLLRSFLGELVLWASSVQSLSTNVLVVIYPS